MFREFARSLHTRNPFYLLSAVSMLTGCYALSRTIGLSPGQWKPLVALMGALQLYELLLLGLAVLLFRRLNAMQDARTAFLLGLLFLADTTYLNTELATSDPWTAPWVALAHLAFLVPKLFVLRDVLGLSSLRTLSLTVAQVGVLMYIPGTFSAIQYMDSKVHALGLGREMLPLVVYLVWWIVGTIPALFLWADRPHEHGTHAMARVVSRASLFLPFASILLHLGTLHWMYGLSLYGAYLTPLLLGVGAWLAYTRSGPLKVFLQWSAPVPALLFSMGDARTFDLTLGDVLILSPLRLALLGTAVVYWTHRSLSGKMSFAWGAALAAALAMSGHSFPAMGRTWTRLVPETYAEFGIAAMVAAFALLGLALAVSLWRPPESGLDSHVPPLGSRREA